MDPNHELKFAFSDFIRLLKRYKKTVIFSVFLGLFACTLYALTRPVVYMVQATFRDKGKTQANIRTSLTDMLFSQAASQDSEAVSTMKSHYLISEVTKKLHTQGYVTKIEETYPEIENAKDNILAEWAYWENIKTPVLEDKKPPFRLQNIAYDGETTQIFIVKFLDDRTYQIKTESGLDLGTGQIGKPFQTDQAQFTLLNPDHTPLLEKETFAIIIHPMSEMAKIYLAQLVIDVDKDDKSLLKVQFRSRDRHFAKTFVNALMDSYQAHLEKDHNISSNAQLTYLEKRQNEVGKTLEKLMEDYVQNVASDMSDSGFTSLQKEMDFLAANLAQNEQKLSEIDFEMKRLLNINCDECVHYDAYTSRGDPAIVNNLLAEIRALRQQTDILRLAIQKGGKSQAPHDLDGITLESSKNLYLAYIKELHELEAAQKQHLFVVGQIQEPDFELSSLTALLNDPVSHERIGKATQLLINLKDENNHTQKEKERIKEELALQKEFLASHIQQMADLMALKLDLMKNKVASLQKVTLDLTRQQIALLKKQLSDYVEGRVSNLAEEKKLLESHQTVLHSRMASIPPKWASEQLLNQNLSLQQRFLENLANMTESKNITKNLEMIQSFPLDLAVAPVNPKPPRLLFFAAFGAVLGFLGASSFLFTRTMIQGIPASFDNLRLANFHTSGKISKFHGDEVSATTPFLDSDLDTLRRLVAHFEPDSPAHKQAKMVLIILGNGPDFSNTLAKLLAKKGQKTLKMQLRFQENSEEGLPGLLQYLDGEVELPQIEPMDGFDRIVAGGVSRYSEELLRSPRFVHLLEKLKPSYDWIIGVTQVNILSAEAENLAKLFDGSVIVITNETLQAVIHFSETLEEKQREALTFVLTSS